MQNPVITAIKPITLDKLLPRIYLLRDIRIQDVSGKDESDVVTYSNHLFKTAVLSFVYLFTVVYSTPF
jgi:hypothetical protein